MVSTVGVVDLTDSGEGLLAQRLAGQPLLNWAIQRLTEAEHINHVVAVVGGTDKQRLSGLIPSNIQVFVTEAGDALARLAAVARTLDSDALVRVPQNCPFVDPALVDQLVADAQRHVACDYVSYCANDGRPAVLSEVGLLAEWCRSESICAADDVCRDVPHRRHGTSYLYANPQRFNIRLIAAPSTVDCSWLKLAVASGKDCELLEDIIEALGPDHLDWHEIVGLIEDHPAMKSQMVSALAAG